MHWSALVSGVNPQTMAVNFYEKGQLSSGFCGWRVVVTIRGKRYQKYFSLNRPSERIPEEL